MILCCACAPEPKRPGAVASLLCFDRSSCRNDRLLCGSRNGTSGNGDLLGELAHTKHLDLRDASSNLCDQIFRKQGLGGNRVSRRKRLLDLGEVHRRRFHFERLRIVSAMLRELLDDITQLGSHAMSRASLLSFRTAAGRLSTLAASRNALGVFVLVEAFKFVQLHKPCVG